MKPLFSIGHTWCCIVLSVFAIIILSTIGALFRSGHESMVGSIDDPENGRAVANTIFSAVAVYIVRVALKEDEGQGCLKLKSTAGFLSLLFGTGVVAF